MDEIPVEVKLKVLAGQVYASAEIGMWCFDKAGNLLYSTCPNEKEFLNFLRLSECMDYLYSREEGWERPVILNDSLGLIWIGEYTYKQGKPELVIVMGPIFLSHTSMKSIENALTELESSVFVRRQMMRILEHVPVVQMPMMGQYALMLHYIIRDEKIATGDLYYQNEERVGPSFGNMCQSSYEMAGILGNTSVVENCVAADRERSTEELLMKGIREGNSEFIVGLSKKTEETYGLVSDTGDILRDSKNTLIVFNALCSRAAIEGGLPAETAKEIERRRTREIELSDSVTVLTKLNHELVNEYTMRVRECRSNPQISSEIQTACDYIRVNVLKELSVDEIAENAGYTTYYFTKKFHKETGVRVTDYIKSVRVEYARILLITTNKKIQEISDSLHFGTRNYFSKVFQEAVGISPTEYREQMEKGKKDEIKKRD